MANGKSESAEEKGLVRMIARGSGNGEARIPKGADDGGDLVLPLNREVELSQGEAARVKAAKLDCVSVVK